MEAALEAALAGWAGQGFARQALLARRPGLLGYRRNPTKQSDAWPLARSHLQLGA